MFRVKVSRQDFISEIKIDPNEVLPHGPTTLLDIVFPVCVFNKVKNIYLFGLEYNQDSERYFRHKVDSNYIDRSNPLMDKNIELEFARKKLIIWKDFFEKRNINCIDLSSKSETPFQKMKLEDVL